MFLRIVAGMLFILGMGMTLFFQEYNGKTIPYPALIWLLGAAMVITSVILTRISFRRAKKMVDTAVKNWKDEYRSSPYSVVVDLVNCEVKRNDYTQEVMKNPTGIYSLDNRIRALDSLVDETRNTKVETVSQCVLIFVVELNNVRKRISSPVIYSDHATLMFKLDAQKQTTVYFKGPDLSDYYIDLEFLG